MARKNKIATPAEVEIVAIKGFDLNWKCRGVQFAIGQTYEHAGPVVACESGFHAIEGHPLDVLDYYAPGHSRYAEVRQSGALARHGSDSKVAAARITISAEITLGDLMQRAVKWVFDRATLEEGASATGERGAASATGYHGAASATGDRGAASATGKHGIAVAGGYDGRAMAADGCALFLVCRDADTDAILHAWGGISGRDGIKPMTWYCLGSDGAPVECAP